MTPEPMKKDMPDEIYVQNSGGILEIVREEYFNEPASVKYVRADQKNAAPDDVRDAFDNIQFQAIRERSDAEFNHKVFVGLMVSDYDRVHCLLRFVQGFVYPSAPEAPVAQDWAEVMKALVGALEQAIKEQGSGFTISGETMEQMRRSVAQAKKVMG